MLPQSKIKVSIAMITYNHEEFIAKALDSILMQSTSFEYEVVIGEDCSTDKTRNILIDYKSKYPEKIQLLLNEKNLGMHRNSNQTLESCKGEYIALLEGDDYWTTPQKLQKQADFLDSHPECAICFHNVMEIYRDSNLEPHPVFSGDIKEFYTLDDLLVRNFIPTAATMYRNGLIKKVPDWVSLLPMGDWPLHILNAMHGKIGYINEIMAVHLNHKGGAWASMRQNWLEQHKAIILLYNNLYNHLDAKYRRRIARLFHDSCVSIARGYEDAGELGQAKDYVVMSFRKPAVISKNAFKTWLRLYMPALYRRLKDMQAASRSILRGVRVKQ